ncbi:unnamed protein product [Dracunculus medinensis]|uniref:Uncharacterized protein n=1 Tax=Dracunculus medinensis TaxID=318479 RepID=A0A0N4U613_DRAME|nr:unnamed protein product [Dracunculus medinensis]
MNIELICMSTSEGYEFFAQKKLRRLVTIGNNFTANNSIIRQPLCLSIRIFDVNFIFKDHMTINGQKKSQKTNKKNTIIAVQVKKEVELSKLEEEKKKSPPKKI